MSAIKTVAEEVTQRSPQTSRHPWIQDRWGGRPRAQLSGRVLLPDESPAVDAEITVFHRYEIGKDLPVESVSWLDCREFESSSGTRWECCSRW